jgi:hypothetical protein
MKLLTILIVLSGNLKAQYLSAELSKEDLDPKPTVKVMVDTLKPPVEIRDEKVVETGAIDESRREIKGIGRAPAVVEEEKPIPPTTNAK